MEFSEETFHEIHQYLSGGGTPGERADFEKRMQADDALAKEVATQRRIRNGLKANEYKNLFKDIHARLQSEGALTDPEPEEGNILPLVPERRSVVRWPYIAAAASIVMAVGLTWYFNSRPASSPIASDVPVAEEPVVTDTTTPAQPQVTPDTAKTILPKQKQSPTPPAQVDKTDFFAEYFEEKPRLESPFSKEKLGLSPSAFRQWRSDTTHVYEGVRYLAAHNAELALQELKQAETSQFQQVKSVADWYIALAYLQQNDLPKCAEQLKKVVADPGNANSKRAAELLGKIQ